MGQPLNNERRAVLEAIVNSGDANARERYYNQLAEYGYEYGELARDVAINYGINGAVANSFARGIGESKGVHLSDQQWLQVSVDLMKADWAARKSLPLNSSDDMKWDAYNSYHSAVFGNYGLPETAWTAHLPLVSAGSDAASAAVWREMLRARSFIPQVANGLTVFNRMGTQNESYYAYLVSTFADGPGLTTLSVATSMAYALKLGFLGETEGEHLAAEWMGVMTGERMLLAIASNSSIQAVDEYLNFIGLPSSKQLRDEVNRANIVPAFPFPVLMNVSVPRIGIAPTRERTINDPLGNPIGTSYGYVDMQGAWIETSRILNIYARNADGSIVKVDGIPFLIGREEGNGGLTVRKTFASGTNRVIRSDIIIPGNPVGIEFSDAGGLLGQQLGYRIAGDNALAGIVASAALKTIGSNFGDILDGVLFTSNGTANGLGHSVKEAFADFGSEFIADLQSAGIGALSSYLTAEIVNVVGIDGLAAEVLNSAGGAVVGQIAQNLTSIATGTSSSVHVFSNVGGALGSAVGSFIGAKLASLIWSPGNIGGQIGASVGAALGAIAATELAKAGTLLAGPVGAAVGAFVGFLVGGLVGSLFGGTPRSGADVSWDQASRSFSVSNAYSRKGGSKSAAVSLASGAAAILDNYIKISGGALHVDDDLFVGNFGMRKSEFVYRPVSSRDKSAITFRVSANDAGAAEKLIDYGVARTLTGGQFKILGGDIVVKRAIYRYIDEVNLGGVAFDSEVLSGNIVSAQAFGSYLENANAVNALLAAEPESVFALETMLTIARGDELGLMKRHASDWFGGYSHLLSDAHVAASNIQFSLRKLDESGRYERFISAPSFERADGSDVFAQMAIIGGLGADNIDLRGTHLSHSQALVIDGVRGSTLAASNTDFVPLVNAARSFNAGALRQSANIAIRANLANEGHETFEAYLSPAAEMVVVGPPAKVTILASGAKARLSVGRSFVAEGEGYAVFRVSISKALGPLESVTVSLELDDIRTVIGDDYLNSIQVTSSATASAGWNSAQSLTFTGSVTQFYVRVPINNDNQIVQSVEASETFALLATVEAGAEHLSNEERVVSGIGTIFDASQRQRILSAPVDDIYRPYLWLDDVYVHGVEGASVGGLLSVARSSAPNVSGAFTISTSDSIARTIDEVATVDAADGNDIVHASNNGDNVFGGAGDDLIYGGVLDDWLIGDGGDDEIHAGGKTEDGIVPLGGDGNFLHGGDGDDHLFGGEGSDWLEGGAGADTLIGGDGDDILAGGADFVDPLGEDRIGDILRGGTGGDQYLFRRGDGADVADDAGNAVSPVDTLWASVRAKDSSPSLQDWSAQGIYSENGAPYNGDDRVVFGAGIGIEHLSLSRSGMDLIIQLTHDEAFTTDRLTLTGWFDSTKRIEWLEFADGQAIRIGDFVSFTVGTNEPDSIIGTDGSDFAVGGSGGDYLELFGGDDIGLGGSGDDKLGGGDQRDTLIGGSGDDTILGGRGDDVISGDGGDDDINGGDGNDLISGGRGNDFLAGGQGNDVFKIARGDGRDIIIDDYAGTWEIVHTSGGGWNASLGYVWNQSTNRVTKNGEVIFDGANWSGYFNYDYNTQTKAATLFRLIPDVAGRVGKDGGSASSGMGDSDILEFGLGINIQDLALQKVGNDLLIGIGSENGADLVFANMLDQLTLKDWFSYGASVTAPIEGFVFAATGTLNTTSIRMSVQGSDRNDVLSGNDGKDWITGGAGDDTINGAAGADILNGNAGQDVINGGADADILYGGEGDDTLDGGAGADVIVGGSGNDTVSFAGMQVTSTGTQIAAFLQDASIRAGDAAGDTYVAIESLSGSAGNDALGGDDGDNVLWGGTGDANDRLYGGKGDDTYVYEAGNGNDIITDGNYSFEEVVANGALKTGYAATWTGLGAVSIAGATRYKYQLQVKRVSDNEIVYSSDLYLYETPQATPPQPTAWAPDGWIGDSVRVDGTKVVRLRVDSTVDAGDDTLELGHGISLADLSFAWAGSDLIISAGGAASSVTLRNQAVTNRRIETLQFADGLAGDLTQLKVGVSGANGVDDLVIGTGAGDSLGGLSGDDIISGGAGDDVLTGGDGNDVLEGGAGADRLDGGGGTDTVRYASSAAAVNVDLNVTTAQVDGDILVSIENVVGSVVGADLLTGDAANNQLFGLDGNDTLHGNAGDDVLIGGAGNDTLYGGDGADNISGDDGADILYGGNGNDLIDTGAGGGTADGQAGNDQLIGGSGNDHLLGGADNDQLSGNDGNDTLDGGAGDDVAIGGNGNDNLRGASGNDSYLFSLNSGADTIVDAIGTNSILFDASVDYRDLWLSRSVGSNDLVIGVIGGNSRITIQNYYATTSPGLMRSIATTTHALYLSHAQPLVDQMSALAIDAPAARMSEVTGGQAALWWEGGDAKPRVSDLELTINEDESTPSLAFGAIDHDGNIAGYTMRTAPEKGVVTLNAATGSFSYQPNANVFGEDSFVLTVTDANGNQADKTVKVRILPINDAPTDIILTLDAGVQDGVPEDHKDPSENIRDPNGIVIGTLAALDVDRPEDSDFGQIKFTTADWRFQIVGNLLKLKSSVPIDYERTPMLEVVVRATDRNGAGLSFEKTLQIAVRDLVDERKGTSGSDTIYGAAGADDIKGFDGNDIIAGRAGNDLLDGGNGDDRLSGEDGDDIIIGGSGADTLLGGGGFDTISGGSENDVVNAGAGNDSVAGDAGNDTIYGEAGDDVLSGGDGDDTLSGGAGADQLNGGAGFDLADYSRISSSSVAAEGVTVDLGNMATNTATAAGDSFSGIEGVRGTRFADVLRGDSGNNHLYGIEGNDELHGNAGDDQIDGGAGNDILQGGDGNDILIGGAGNDIMTGGSGNDTYVITRSSGADTINNYHTNVADNDVLGFQDTIADSELWFQKSGNDLLISVIGTSTSTRIKDWYVNSTLSEQTNYKIDFIEAGVSRVINAEGLVNLMADETKPSDRAGHDLLMTDVGYREAWNSYWGENPAPVLSEIADISLAEDATTQFTVTVTDTHDGTVSSDPNSLTMIVKIYDPATGEQITDGSRVAVSFGAPNAQGQRVVTLTPTLNFFGSAHVKVWAADAGGRYSEERSFDVSVDAKADMPVIESATAGSGGAGTFHDGDTIPLHLSVSFPDRDGSENQTLLISGIPVGITLNKGSYNSASQIWTVEGGDIEGLELVGPPSWFTDLSLNIKARAVETSNGNIAETAATMLAVAVNAAPTDISVSGSIREGSVYGSPQSVALSTLDPDGGTFIYELLANPGNRFAVDALSGVISVLTTDPTQINFETAVVSGNAITVRATDNGGLSVTKSFYLPVVDVNEQPFFDRTSYTFGAISEWSSANSPVGTVSASDPDTLNASYGRKKFYFQNSAGGIVLSSADLGGNIKASSISADGLFQINADTGAITLRSGVNFEAAPDYTHIVIVTDGISDATSRARSVAVKINIKDENEAPTLTLHNPTLTIAEQPDNVMMWSWRPVTAADPDGNASYNAAFYKLTGDYSDYFLVNSQTGQLALQRPLDYEDPNSPKAFNLTMNVWDGGREGAGNHVAANFAVNVVNVNEAPIISVGSVINIKRNFPGSDYPYRYTYSGSVYGYDEDAGYWGGPLQYAIEDFVSDSGALTSPPVLLTANGNASFHAALDSDYIGVGGWSFQIRAYDQAGLSGYAEVRSEDAQWISDFAPVVLDLNGDGISLTSIVDNGIRFDMDGDGARDVTGWVSAEDGLLALDLDGNGMIDRGNEISFTSALPGAVSDLEGLRAFDSNANGFLDVGDARFGEFRVWRDINQDGFSQIAELKALSEHGIAAINLTVALVDQSQNGSPIDNRIHGYAEFIRADGTAGSVGDVFLSYIAEGGSVTRILGDHRSVIGIDLDGGGVALSDLRHSAVAFDMVGNGALRTTGWVGAGDAMLAIDLNEDGTISSGRELSLGDSESLSPLQMYDSNGDGVIDVSDSRFSDFRVWQDLDQDGISQAGELRTLLAAGIARITLPGPFASFNAAAGESLVYGEIALGMVNGEARTANSLLLGYGDVDLGALAPPIIVNWDGDDTQFVSLGASTTRFDMNGDGVADRTSWLDQGDAFLALDRNGNGKVDGIGEISFVGDKLGAKTDLEGLRGFDSNGDGRLSGADAAFGNFKLWFDNNSNGATEVGELLALADLGVSAIDLIGSAGGAVEIVGGNRIYNRTRFIKADGSAIDALDVGLSYLPLNAAGAAAGTVANTDGVSPPAGVSQDALPKLAIASRTFDRKASKYRLAAMGGGLYVTPKKAEGTIDERAGLVGASTILSFKNASFGVLAPITLDLDGDGLELKSIKKAKAAFDMNGDGINDDTGWTGKGDGFLVIDRNGDGKITGASELSFLSEKADARSDLDALAVLDGNKDGRLDVKDTRFGELKVWLDSNSNGVTDDGELKTLADHGIASIGLAGQAVNQMVKVGANAVLATGIFTRTDGSTGTLGDTALAYRPGTAAPTSTRNDRLLATLKAAIEQRPVTDGPGDQAASADHRLALMTQAIAALGGRGGEDGIERRLDSELSRYDYFA
ncbi:Ca2+-binding RTX toxin-like protein [Sphingomonas zeicaulis]|uniref:cadherin domain-containing protein n=1 Tax=Sphingomonas zeicaulis TaxID=1632740 RepID=UPI003D19045D